MASGFAAMRNLRRQAVRAPVNPSDKCTIISIYPKQIHEKKITLQPGEFTIEPGSYENPSLLLIGPSSWWRDVGEDEPLLEIPHSSAVMAESIIRDWMNGLLAANGVDTGPGIFWLPGNVQPNELIGKYKSQLDKAQGNQIRYYQQLVKLSDALWARTNGNPLSVPDDARLACAELQLNREWTQQFARPEVIKCIACGSMRNPAYPICPTCKAVVDKSAFEKMGLKFAE